MRRMDGGKAMIFVQFGINWFEFVLATVKNYNLGVAGTFSGISTKEYLCISLVYAVCYQHIWVGPMSNTWL